MSDRLAAVDAAQPDDQVARLRRIEEGSVESCQPGVVDWCVVLLEELRAIREAAERLQ